jgi:hypothetical protein
MDMRGVKGYLKDKSRQSWGFCYPARSDGTALMLLCEVRIGNPVYDVALVDFDAEEEARDKGLLTAVFTCWKVILEGSMSGWPSDDAGAVGLEE